MGFKMERLFTDVPKRVLRVDSDFLAIADSSTLSINLLEPSLNIPV